jgi:hypothetical protein
VLRTALIATGSLLLAAAPTPPDFDAEDVLARMRAAYPALDSYADSGTVLDEAPGFTDRYSFRTLYIREPRYLLIDHNFVASEYKNGFRLESKDRSVLWMEKGELQTWFSESDAHELYPSDGGKQVSALNNASAGTGGISVLIPSHLYTKSNMVSVVHATTEPTADGFDTVNGRRCFRILGVERWRYPSGQETGVRPITLWIDTETYLLQKILEDTPKGSPRGHVSRRIITLKPEANPKLEPAQFHFVVPER